MTVVTQTTAKRLWELHNNIMEREARIERETKEIGTLRQHQERDRAALNEFSALAVKEGGGRVVQAEPERHVPRRASEPVGYAGALIGAASEIERLAPFIESAVREYLVHSPPDFKVRPPSLGTVLAALAVNRAALARARGE